MGYEIGVTPIQMAAATSAVANGGLLIEPRVLRAIVRDGRREVIAPKVLRRVITPETASTLTSIMEAVVERGTGGEAKLDRYLVAGKTGTAKKAVPGGYSETDYNVSFAGFVPSRDPLFTILVVVDTPRTLPKYGGRVAAPIFRRIADAALQYAGALPSVDPAPPIVVPARRKLMPEAPRSGAVLANASGIVVMPDLRGLSLREAMRLTAALQLRMNFEGDGTVTVQSPEPGAPIAPGDRGLARLRRDPDPAPSPGNGGRR
jgi:membrane peptidoglycan carboxypeptidase